MNRYKIKLVLLNNPQRVKYQTEYAEGAVQASSQAQKHNPGYLCVSADLDEDEENNDNNTNSK